MFFTSKDLDALAAVEGIGLQMARLIMFRQPVPGASRPDLTQVESLAELRARLEAHDGIDLDESAYAQEDATLAWLDPSLDSEKVLACIENPNSNVRALLEKVFPSMVNKSAGGQSVIDKAQQIVRSPL